MVSVKQTDLLIIVPGNLYTHTYMRQKSSNPIFKTWGKLHCKTYLDNPFLLLEP